MPLPLIAAHRGGAGLWPENSLTAFRHALTLPVDLIEFDVHRSRDGVLVVHHDATLERTTTGHGPLADKSWAELQRLSVKGTFGERPPLLDEVIALARPTPVDLRLEIKCKADRSRYDGIEAEIIQTLRAKNMLDRTIITSFDWDVLETVQSLAELRGLIALAGKDIAAIPNDLTKAVALIKAKAIPEMAVPVAVATPEIFAHAREAGLRIGLTGVNTQEDIARAFDLEASAFTTNRPDWAIEERTRRLG